MTNNNDEKINQLRKVFQEASTVIIGAGSGLSTSAGYEYGGERFTKNFSDFQEKYGITDMYSGSFYEWKTPEERWAFMSRVINLNRYTPTPKAVYDDLLQLIKGKNYFVITTNVDHCFQKAGFDKERLFYTQGDYGLFQCSRPCKLTTFENEEIIKKMVEEQKNMKIPSELIPKCPFCGSPMTANLRGDDKFVEDDGWHLAAQRYDQFLKKYKSSDSILFLELGVGFNTPGIIKYPFWQMTFDNKKAVFATINYGESVTAEEIKDRSICIKDDIGKVIKQLL